jgi:hypothetical protein
MEKYVAVVVDHESIAIHTKLKQFNDVIQIQNLKEILSIPCERGPFSVFP